MATMKVLACQVCQGEMRRVTKSSGNAGGLALALIVFVIGVLLCLTMFGAIIGVPLIILSLFMGGKKHKVWLCKQCGCTLARA